MSLNFWLTEEQFKKIQPLLPNKPRGVARLPACSRQAGGSCQASSIVFSGDIGGAMSLRNTARPRRSTIATGAGLRRVCSNAYSRL